jgi:hypothetical protein
VGEVPAHALDEVSVLLMGAHGLLLEPGVEAEQDHRRLGVAQERFREQLEADAVARSGRLVEAPDVLLVLGQDLGGRRGRASQGFSTEA